MGKKNPTLLLVSFLTMLMWQMPFLSGNSEAESPQGYKEDIGWTSFDDSSLDVKIDNALSTPLQAQCYLNNTLKIAPKIIRPRPKIIEPGQSYVETFYKIAISSAGPKVYCNIKWGPFSLEFTAFNIRKNHIGEGKKSVKRYVVHSTGLYRITNGKLSQLYSMEGIGSRE